ncbi:MAG: hypothetical protein WC453_04015 [Patescibacteria group bacterium]
MEELINKSRELALAEISRFAMPKLEHFLLANAKGQELAAKLGADQEIVLLGTMLMDLKIGQCFGANRLAEHVAESSRAAQAFLRPFNLDPEIFRKIVDCIESHHGVPAYSCLEAEICANADCYRFLSPAGFFNAFMIFSGRGADFTGCLNQLEAKLEEKHNILSLDICRQELEPYYQEFKELIKKAREN